MYNYGNIYKNTPQSEPVAGKKQVKNNAGGYVFALDEWKMLDRFLILGSESNTYYATASKISRDNAKNIEGLIARNGVAVVDRIVEVSDQGLAVKNDPAIFALAMCAKLGDEATRKAAYAALPKVCRIGTHLFHFAEYAEAFGGWGRGMRNAVANWYNTKTPEQLQLQVVKYKQRDGWSHRDLLRLSHAKPSTEMHNEIFEWVTKGTSASVFEDESDDALWLIWAAEEIKNATSVKGVVALIQDFNLPREVVPTQWLNHPEVWEALLDRMPMTAMIRNLGNMSKVGLLAPLSKPSGLVCDRLRDQKTLHKSRIHPLGVLTALKVYENGSGYRGSGSWTVDGNIVEALDDAFYAAFKNVEPSGKRILMGVDVSGSMTWGNIAGLPGITPNVAAAAMALVTAKTEKQYLIRGFANDFRDLKITTKDSLTSAMRKTNNMSFGATDCALPMIYAKKNKLEVDAFVVYTDSETWYGNKHPFQALKDYRKATGIPAKLVVVGMTATGFTIADPSDAGMLDVVGMSADTPKVMANFIRD